MKILSSLFLLLLLAVPALAQPTPRSVTLVTVGPGDASWERFGHVLVWVRDPQRLDAPDAAYNWGLFSFNEPGFIWHFIHGRMTYWMDAFSLDGSMAVYDEQQRHVVYQRLPLSDAQIVDLVRRCEINRLPGNKHYRYDYFRDNCSTRVRDLLDAVSGGEVRRVLEAQKPLVPMSYRDHAMRLMQDDLWLSLGIDFALGPACDRVLTPWEECFLPTRMAAYLNGWAVNRVETPSPRPPEPQTVPDRRPVLAMIGALAGALMASVAMSDRPWRRRIAITLVALWWALCAAGAVFLLYVWLLTDHWAAHANQNLLHYSPLAVVGLALLIGSRRSTRPRVAGAARVVAILILSISAGGLALRLAGVLSQANVAFILLAFPIHAATLLVLLRRREALQASPTSD